MKAFTLMSRSFTIPAEESDDRPPLDLPNLVPHRPTSLRVYPVGSSEEEPLVLRCWVPVEYADARVEGLRRRVEELEGRLAGRGRKTAEAARATYDAIRKLREQGVKWVVIARKLKYKSARSVQQRFRTLHRKFGG